MAVYVTGDIHGSHDISKLNTRMFVEQKEMTKADTVIICGDFGLVWNRPGSRWYKHDKVWLDWLDEKPWTTVFVDGNHENFELLDSQVECEFNGAKAHRVRPSIYHIKRGELLTLEGKKFFMFGGASSHDKEIRTERIDWWPQELPSYAEQSHGLDTLESQDWQVDFVISHCAPGSVAATFGMYEQDTLTKYFDEISGRLKFDHWYFGHYHLDKEFGEKYTCLYDCVLRIL